jgi:molecular chaperone DnaJ
MANYYETLGVSKDSTQDDIKKAYRKLSIKYHPDKEGGDEERFKTISEAYNTIGDKDKRTKYDTQGQQRGFDGDPFDAFSQFFNNQGKRRRQQQQQQPVRMRGKDLKINLTITLEETYWGEEKELKYRKKISNGRKCPQCNGRGIIMQTIGSAFFRQMVNVTCPACAGCGFLNGGDVIERTLKFTIPRGIDSGHFMKKNGGGDDTFNGISGDLLIVINVEGTEDRKKEGMNYIYLKKVNPIECILGVDLTVPHFEGDIRIKVPELHDRSKALKAKGKGFTDGGGMFGDMLIYLEQDMPSKLTDEERKKLSEILTLENFKR